MKSYYGSRLHDKYLKRSCKSQMSKSPVLPSFALTMKPSSDPLHLLSDGLESLLHPEVAQNVQDFAPSAQLAPALARSLISIAPWCCLPPDDLCHTLQLICITQFTLIPLSSEALQNSLRVRTPHPFC